MRGRRAALDAAMRRIPATASPQADAPTVIRLVVTEVAFLTSTTCGELPCACHPAQAVVNAE